MLFYKSLKNQTLRGKIKMYKLTNINISFDKNIIENGEIDILDGKITAIKGKSGSGKTSILYLIGLISSNDSYSYYLNGEILDLKNEKLLSQYKKNKIGYVFQDNSVIDALNVGDNIKFAAKISGRNLTEKEIDYYLNFVELNVNKKNYPKKLSGGEQQRLAIACAMAKDPEIIIADEPTSALDDYNSDLVINIFKKFVQLENKKVVIATHNKNVYSQADIIYKIENKKILRDPYENNMSYNQNITETKEKYKNTRLGFLYYISYIKRISKKMKIQKRLMLFLCAIAIAITVAITCVGNGLIAYEKESINTISDKKIALINLTAPITSNIDIDENLSITSEEYDSIVNISGIDTVYAYYEFRSVGYNIETLDSYYSTTIDVTTEDGSNSVSFSTENDTENQTVLILPYYEEDSYDKQLDIEFDNVSSNYEDSIYISSTLANMLNITSDDTYVSLQLDLGVPIGTTDTTLYVGDDSEYDADVDLSEITTFTLNIAGVLDSTVTANYSADSECVIYMPISMMNEYLENVQSNFNYNSIPEEITVNDWSPSAYIIYATSYTMINSIIDKLESINSNFKAINEYQDVETMTSTIEGVKDIALYISLAVLIIVDLLMIIIYINYMFNRKNEIAILKANGITKKELYNLIFVESIIRIIIIFIISIFVLNISKIILNLLFDYNIVELDVFAYIKLLCIAIVSIVLPTIGSTIIINRFKPDKIIRN